MIDNRPNPKDVVEALRDLPPLSKKELARRHTDVVQRAKRAEAIERMGRPLRPRIRLVERNNPKNGKRQFLWRNEWRDTNE